MKKVDMSEQAVLRRLRQVDQLRELSLSLMKAKKLHDEKIAEQKRASLNETKKPQDNKDEY